MCIGNNWFCTMLGNFSEIIYNRLGKFCSVFSGDRLIAKISGMNALF